MSKTISPSDAETLAQHQCDEYSKFIGTFSPIPPDVIHDASEVAAGLQPTTFYIAHPNIRFIWELLDLRDNSKIFRAAVDAWLKVQQLL